jgi:hypothetical protein
MASGAAAPDAGPENSADVSARSRASLLSGRRIRLVLGTLVVAMLAIAGILTRSVSGASGIAAADRSLEFMQRMGPPPVLTSLYQLLAADTVAIRNSSTGQLISTGLYQGDVLKLGTVPGFLDGLPGGVKRFIALGTWNSYLTYYVVPARGLTSRAVRVQTSWGQLAGAVVSIDRSADLAAIVAVVPQGQISKFTGPINVYSGPLAAGTLRMLVVHRNPEVYARSAGYVLTSGGASGEVGSENTWCDLPVNGASAGSPVFDVSPEGATLLGLAVPSSAPGRSSVIGSWTVNQFMSRVIPSGIGAP